jgi:uncharacterized protein YaiE (UPF0345 family)
MQRSRPRSLSRSDRDPFAPSPALVAAASAVVPLACASTHPVAAGQAQSARRWRHSVLIAGVLVAGTALLSSCDAGRSSTAAAADQPTAEAAVNGWTILTPRPLARLVYVSSSSGSDSNSGLSEQSPKATIQAAMTLLRQGSPDWLYIKKGDQFAGGLPDWYLSGSSVNEPMVVTTYGTSPNRPVFHVAPTSFGLSVHGTAVHDVAFVGLQFVADTYDGSNGQPYGVSLLQPCTNVLIEDCRIERFFTNLRFQGYAGNHRNLALRRCVIADAYTTSTGNAEGIYVEGVDGCLIEECLFDHNGWLASVPGAVATIYRHNIYIQGNNTGVAIRGNIIARGGSHGLQARAGGEVRNNVFLGNAINLLVGDNINNNGAVTASVIGNVILDGRDISSGEPRGWAAQFQCLASGEIAGNVAAHQLGGSSPVSFELDSTLGVGVNNVNFHDNVAYKWGAPLSLVNNRFSGLALNHNDVQEYAGGQTLRNNSGTLPGLTSAGNRMFSTAAANQWLYYAGQPMSLASWMSIVNDTTSSATQIGYANAEEKIGDYDRTIGGGGNLDSFLSRARLQSRTNWNEFLLGTNVAEHFRANFRVGSSTQPGGVVSTQPGGGGGGGGGGGTGAGWTPLSPTTATRHVYVSSSTGSDGNSGLSAQSPKATIQAAVALLRSGSPDWLHIRNGDQFNSTLGDWSLSGRSATEPMVVTTYGTLLDRPLFRCGAGDGLTIHSTGIHDVAFVGLAFVADGYNGSNSAPYGISLLAPSANVLIEDCKIERFFTGLRLQGFGGNQNGLKLRRSVIIDSYTTGAAHAEGIYVEGVDDLLIEECVFDHNGWLPSAGAVADIYRHNIYIQGNNNNVTIRGNIIARAGSHGLQARSGGDVRNNLFLGNSINLLVGNNINNNGAVNATVIGNVILDGKDIDNGLLRGWAAQFQCFASGEVAYNVAAHQLTGRAPQSFEIDSNIGVGINNLNFHHNIAYKWGAPLLLVNNRFTGLLLHDNDVQEANGAEVLSSNFGAALAGLTSAGNRMFSTRSASQWLFYSGQSMSLATWKAMVGDSSSSALQVGYPQPEEKIGDYDAATGGSGSLDSFMNRVRQQSRTRWNSALVGTNAAAHFRANFGLQ